VRELGIRADVAQPVEQRFRKPPVGSSSLPVGSGRIRTCQVISAVLT
jgi:hypothetical protein